MSTEQITTRTCAHCGAELVRKSVTRRKARGPKLELESSVAFSRRLFCDLVCRRDSQRLGLGERPLCACGCGTPTTRRKGGWSIYAAGCYTGPKQKPRHPRWTDDGDRFWDWFAGFADGEGFFGFLPRRFKRTYYTPVMRINVRLDDRAIMDEIASRLGGVVRVQPAYETSRPQARWGITSMSDCLRLIDVLDAHPLRAKKARDYATWREAVLEKDTKGNTERLEQLVLKLIEDRRWDATCVGGGDAE